MVPCITGTCTRFFFASSIPFVIASCTSFALPSPWPTTPFSFPTTTIAEKLKVRPPFVVFTTRLMATTLSLSSTSPPAFTLLTFTLAILIISISDFRIEDHLLLHHQLLTLHAHD